MAVNLYHYEPADNIIWMNVAANLSYFHSPAFTNVQSKKSQLSRRFPSLNIMQIFLPTLRKRKFHQNCYFQPGGDCGAGAPGALQDPHRYLPPGHGGGQPEALVPGQQVSLQIMVCEPSKVPKTETQSEGVRLLASEPRPVVAKLGNKKALYDHWVSAGLVWETLYFCILNERFKTNVCPLHCRSSCISLTNNIVFKSWQSFSRENQNLLRPQGGKSFIQIRFLDTE